MGIFKGEVTSDKLFIGKNNLQIDEEGLLSESIFGPINSYKCKCGKLTMVDIGKVCPKCGVLCDSNELRLTSYGKISLIFPVIRPTKRNKFLKLVGNKNRILLDFIKTDANIASQFYIGVSSDGIKIKIFKDLSSETNWYKVPFRITGIYSLILGLRYLAEKLQIPAAQEYFTNNYIIREVKVLPPDIRPIIQDPNKPNEFRVSEINKYYQNLLRVKKKHILLKDSILVDEEDWLEKIHIAFKLQMMDQEVIETQIMDYDIQTAKHQFYVHKIYQEVYASISGKYGFIRSSILGKTIEFSSRSVVRVDPSLQPYKIKIAKKILYKLWHPYFLYFLYNVKGLEYEYCFNNITSSDYETAKELFNEFLAWFCEEDDKSIRLLDYEIKKERGLI